MAPFSAYDTLTAPQLTGLVQIPIDSLPVMHCLQQSMSPAGNDTAAFAGDQFTRLELQCLSAGSTAARPLTPCLCLPFIPAQDCLSRNVIQQKTSLAHL